TVVIALPRYPVAFDQLAVLGVQAGEETAILDGVNQPVEVQRRGAERHLPGVPPGDMGSGDVALAARPDGQHDVAPLAEQAAEALILLTRDRAVLVHVHLREALRNRTAGQLRVLQLAIAVLVQPLEDAIERLRLDGFAGVSTGGPARDVQPTVLADHRRHTD